MTSITSSFLSYNDIFPKTVKNSLSKCISTETTDLRLSLDLKRDHLHVAINELLEHMKKIQATVELTVCIYEKKIADKVLTSQQPVHLQSKKFL